MNTENYSEGGTNNLAYSDRKTRRFKGMRIPLRAQILAHKSGVEARPACRCSELFSLGARLP